ncbi:cyclic pyranopterin phosphate synthase [Quadrisphaera granulorum]|uniref:GTP 3',8-cyclase n=1 Tax=Quadrisphaera granulorum TaxID=317664 RepID=A0A315ZTY0_9ACTN|nr:cyclic pyranopterin phosphate synthase [Quadrisphaera granulorum]SZE98221.1 cyclic pyranopterin phosphate synthase [Quadrisphaera granulorum]
MPMLPADRPPVAAVPGLLDRHGRTATDLRVSLTDRCNLRCTYCMPPEGLDWTPASQLLSDEEVIRLITIAVTHLGITEVRFTGGEPLLRRGLESIVAATSALRTAHGSAPETSLTTNALGLTRRAAGLAQAGLTRVNASLDTLQPERFARITHRDRLPDVLAGLRAAADAGLGPIKVNAVLLRGINDDEAPDLLTWALREGYQLRFIEQMPLDPHGAWDRSQMIDADQILTSLAARFDLTPEPSSVRGSSPAELWHVRPLGAVQDEDDDEPRGTVGVIASVTRPFCADCDRTRLTADGQVRECLFGSREHDLRSLLRCGATDAQLADVWRAAMWGKVAGHGSDDPAAVGFDQQAPQPTRPMSAIGG